MPTLAARKKRALKKEADEAYYKKVCANTAFIVPIEDSRDKYRRELDEKWNNRPAPQEKIAPYSRENEAILKKIDVLTCHNTAVHIEDRQWVNLEKDKKNIDTICNDIERLGLGVKLRVQIDKPNTEHIFAIEQKKRIANRSDISFESVVKKEFTQTSDEKGFIFIKDVFQLDKEENYKHIFTASSDIERKSTAGLITRHRGTLRSYIFHIKKDLNKVADKELQKRFTLEMQDKDVVPIKNALMVLNLDVEKPELKDEVYNEDVQASVKLFQTAYIPPKKQIHPYNAPLKIDGEVSDQTLMAMDEAIVNNVKFNNPQVVHFDGENLSFLDPDTGEVHVCDGSGLQINGEQLCYKEETNDSSLDGIDISGYTVGATGTMQATAQVYYETLSRKQKHVLAENFKQKISSVGKAELVKTSTIKSVASTALSKNMAKKLGILGGLVIIADVVDDEEVRASHVVNVLMVGVGFVPVVGWIISGGYFLADVATFTMTDKSLGEHIGEGLNDLFDRPLDKPLLDFK